eukprot:1481419-Amphidinium_carterae.1
MAVGISVSSSVGQNSSPSNIGTTNKCLKLIQFRGVATGGKGVRAGPAHVQQLRLILVGNTKMTTYSAATTF